MAPLCADPRAGVAGRRPLLWSASVLAALVASALAVQGCGGGGGVNKQAAAEQEVAEAGAKAHEDKKAAEKEADKAKAQLHVAEEAKDKADKSMKTVEAVVAKQQGENNAVAAKKNAAIEHAAEEKIEGHEAKPQQKGSGEETSKQQTPQQPPQQPQEQQPQEQQPQQAAAAEEVGEVTPADASPQSEAEGKAEGDANNDLAKEETQPKSGVQQFTEQKLADGIAFVQTRVQKQGGMSGGTSAVQIDAAGAVGDDDGDRAPSSIDLRSGKGEGCDDAVSSAGGCDLDAPPPAAAAAGALLEARRVDVRPHPHDGA